MLMYDIDKDAHFIFFSLPCYSAPDGFILVSLLVERFLLSFAVTICIYLVHLYMGAVFLINVIGHFSVKEQGIVANRNSSQSSKRHLDFNETQNQI